MKAQVQSGELFSGAAFDVRAYWPKPAPDPSTFPLLESAKCEFLIYTWKGRHRETCKGGCNAKKVRAAVVNGIRLKLCSLHIKYLQRRPSTEVFPDPSVTDANAKH